MAASAGIAIVLGIVVPMTFSTTAVPGRLGSKHVAHAAPSGVVCQRVVLVGRSCRDHGRRLLAFLVECECSSGRRATYCIWPTDI